MKAKMAVKRAQGFNGWERCPAQMLHALLHHLITKGDPVDVGNVAMMLFALGEPTIPPPAVSSDVARNAERWLITVEAFEGAGVRIRCDDGTNPLVKLGPGNLQRTIDALLLAAELGKAL